MTERFTYSGSATIGGVQLPNVRLQENAPDGGLRSWEGSARFSASDTPEGFPGDLEGPQSVLIELPDGRTGQVLVTSIGFNGAHWSVGLLGTGPAPK
ncbi:hypothetical protein SAMN04487981_101617 [Streptomyces sp. cf386]|uniref:hypothetical protein n=1 Tax=Streptomyces sp. cf386 TaxID=1761904 RepID=UPI00088DA47A|nr:hypothetical protein [Streptomyces sp. cf386]SDM46778.1 hypothetical protein SAMN04487981_101617 [Streptomyces sp. cf386]